MTVIVSCVNLKGGVGKTALAVNLAAIAGDIHGKKTLLIDVDPQTNATFSCVPVDAWEKHSAENGTIADILGLRAHTSAEGADKTPKSVIIRDVFANVDLLPSHLDLFTIDLALDRPRKESILERELREVIADYDLVVCDCPPNFTLPTQNALSMSSHFVIPVTLDYLSGLGIALLVNHVERFGNEIENTLTNAGIVISRVGRSAIYREETENSIRNEFGNLVLRQTLTERSDVSKASSMQVPVHKYTNRQATDEFLNVANELLNRIGVI